ncbi:MAG: polysaccharide deacetylase [Oscillospiraceae bacterium]|nr:polysaccharide deacetylase [Oscillospiraceae bacterium]
MRFGSVEFFKVLIKTVLAIFFFVPLILAVVFGVLFVQKNAKVTQLQEENSAIQQESDKNAVIADVLVGQRIASAADIREIIDRSGTSYDDLISLALSQKDIDANGLYGILSKSGLSDKDIIDMAAAKQTVGASEFYDIMSKNGITPTELAAAVLQNGVSPEELYEMLSEAGMSDADIIDYINNRGAYTPGNNTSGGNTDTSDPLYDPNQYADLYPDMYVTAPASYNYEEGTIYFTFDDGPSIYTNSILEYMRKYNAKGTWFVVPSRTDSCYASLRAIANDGHTIGVHSATHEYETIYASVEAFLKDFHEAWEIVRDATGQTPEIFRFPGGSKNDFNEETRDAIIKEMTRRGFRFYDWNVESGDVNGASWDQMYNSIPRDCHALKRPVILMHDSAGTPNAVYVLEDVLRVLAGEDYKFDAIHNDTEPVQFIGPFS